MPYDPESGQVYEETIVSTHDAYGPARLRLLHSRRPKSRTTARPQLGCRSLLDIALSKLLQNLDSLTTESLQGLDPLTLDRLWKWIEEADCHSLAVWQLFARTRRFDLKFTKVVEEFAGFPQHMHLRLVTDLGYNASFDWLVNLTLSGGPYPTSQLINISALANLRYVHIQSNPHLWDISFPRMFRAWAMAAKSQGALTRLQMIFFDETAHLDVGACLPLLNHFSRLDLVVVKCANSNKACGTISGLRKRNQVARGWTLHHQSGEFKKYSYSVVDPARFYHSNDHNSFAGTWLDLVKGYTDHRARNGSDSAVDNLPMLDFRVGRLDDHLVLRTMPKGRLDLRKLVSFERDSQTPRSTQQLSSNLQEEPSTKKRKVRASKITSLSELFNDPEKHKAAHHTRFED